MTLVEPEDGLGNEHPPGAAGATACAAAVVGLLTAENHLDQNRTGAASQALDQVDMLLACALSTTRTLRRRLRGER